MLSTGVTPTLCADLHADLVFDKLCTFKAALRRNIHTLQTESQDSQLQPDIYIVTGCKLADFKFPSQG
jgi:hypothetical protein